MRSRRRGPLDLAGSVTTLPRIERITPILMGGLLQAGLLSNWTPQF